MQLLLEKLNFISIDTFDKLSIDEKMEYIYKFKFKSEYYRNYIFLHSNVLFKNNEFINFKLEMIFDENFPIKYFVKKNIVCSTIKLDNILNNLNEYDLIDAEIINDHFGNKNYFYKDINFKLISQETLYRL